MADVISEYPPPNAWWNIQQELTLDPGTWVDVTGFRVYSEEEATTEAQKRAREADGPYRIIARPSNVPGPTVNPPTSWWEVWWIDPDNVQDGFQKYVPGGNNNLGKFWSEADAQTTSQKLARDEFTTTRVQTYPLGV